MTKAKHFTSEELTFEIDGPRITADKFRQGINAFLDMINEVVMEMSGSKHNIRWIVSVSSGSLDVHLRAESATQRVPSYQVTRIVDTIQGGLRTIEAGPQRPRYFNDTALKKARELASIIDKKKKGLESIRIRRNGDSDRVTTKTLINVDSLIGTASTDIGSIEGILSGIFQKSGGYKLWVYDDVLDKNITCHFPPERLRDALNSFDRRVSVSGLIHYRKGGEINSVQVEEFEVFPDSSTLPGFDEVLGLFGRAQ